MYPIILIGPAALPTYPLLVLVALWAGMWLAARRAQQLGLDGDHVYNAGLYGFLAGIIGARLYFVLSHWENYAADLTQIFSLSRSALSVGEGFLVAGVVVLIYLLRKQVPLGTFFDAAAPGIALAIIIANIGAFLGGVALGAVSDVPWAIEIAGVARHPAQLYDAAAGAVILMILYFVRSYRPWPGFQFWFFVVLYGTSRLFFEIFRARPYLIGDSYLGIQVMALIAIVVSLAVMAYNFTRDPEEESPVESV
jgi:prolipoprotein diacylglyceryl transferase